LSVTISVPRRLIDALEENGLSIVDAITMVLGNRLDPHEIARARIELAEKYLEEAKDYINKKDAVQASEKMYKVVEECIKALAETLNTPETQEARKNGRWFTWLLGSAARSVANRLGRPEIVETWALAYDVHVRGFHEAKYNVDNVAWGLAYIERLLKITKDVVETSSKK